MPESTNQLAIAVDLDGTLIRSDLLLESYLLALATDPWRTLLRTPRHYLRGPASLKHWLAEQSCIDAACLPYDRNVLDYVDREKRKGREVHLVSASNEKLVAQVAEHLGLFDGYQGSTPENNMKGKLKAQWLADRFPDGFEYVGDSGADLAVWERSSGAVLVGSAIARRGAVKAAVIEEIQHESGGWAAWLKLLRLHQWAKNALIFVPLLLSGEISPGNITASVLAFLFFGLVASAGYVINDLLDLQADRAHWSKKHRPLASGMISGFHAIFASVTLIAVGISGMAIVSIPAAAFLIVYLALTLFYSMKIKQLPFVDLVVLGVLFTLRVAVGIAVMGHEYSAWLLTFSLFFFFSLSAIKRTVELRRSLDRELPSVARRGYVPEDLSLVQSFGVSFSAASLVIMTLYLDNEAMRSGVYSSAQWLWAVPLVILLWLCRVWFVASRGVLDDDPVVFAIKDRLSWLCAAGVGLSVLLAHLA